ncbi:plasmid stabilization protein ParE [Pseudoroseomonas deserti]|uniref:Toxin n=1 Tax=Teichococcus deserti TaxID=1817963 RepID=A0A1V2H1R1_9PROT|nr:type II toxin-antitoxin system RelE/ParE family toxin [Pseudoroseomonas deserti]ONG53217.1 plasmid stabilization protein ParE [Pseudoroseomonas deserti]
MSGFRLTPAAQADLDDIWDSTLDRWGGIQAERYLLAIRDLCDSLAEGSIPGRAVDRIRPGYRVAQAGAHLLFFMRAPDGTVEVIRILHQRRDVSRQL